MHTNLKALIGKLDDTCRRALEAAAGLCLTRTHYDVDIEHLLIKLLDVQDSDIGRIVRHYGLDHSKLLRDLTSMIDRLKTGNARTPALSPRVPRLINDAWSLASIDYGVNRIRSGHLLLTLLAEEDLARMAREASAEFHKIAPDDLRTRLVEITGGSAEDSEQGPGGFETAQPGSPQLTKTPGLDQFTIDLTGRAKQGQLDPVLGRDAEIRQVIDILTRRRQNNPILTGEAGVGKTAVVEGLALRIVAGDVPKPLQGVSLRVLDLALLQAGAGVKGEFENRLKSVIAEVKASPQPIITFIDEAHTLIGAGGQAGQGDAANLLKPALARGELRTIAATTWAEYKKYFEKDPALSRRFQVVKVEEPAETVAVTMMRGLVATLEQHHKVRVLDEAVEAAVKLSHRYISGRQLPDKAVSVLDTACARVALGQVSQPAALEDAGRRMSLINTEMDILERETITGTNHGDRLAELMKEKADEEKRRADLQARWEQERKLVEEIAAMRLKLEQHAEPVKAFDKGTAKPPDKLTQQEVETLQVALVRLNKELSDLQGEVPLLRPCVDGQVISEVISAWTGIPVGRMVKDEIKTVLNLKDHLENRVVGQSHALDALSQRLRTARAKLEDPRRPIGVFLFVGPSGVGKTETALALAELLFGSDQNLTTINMSEFKEEHKVSLLMGSPPGYVGYGEGGVLTEAVRRKPYSVVLFDEMEKAHIGVQDIFYQVFDKGTMKDGEGRDIDFKNTVIIITSNAGTDRFMTLCADPTTRPEPEALADAVRPDLLKYFKPAFLGRVMVVPFYPISQDIMRRIIELQLNRVRSRIKENHRAAMSYDEALITAIANRCTEVESGARNVDHILTRTLLPELSKEFLARMAAGEVVNKVHITVEPSGSFRYEVAE